MSFKILVTDSLFILDEHIKKLNAAGYEVERLDKPDASEAELVKAVQGKVGYILGGIEHVTEKVIDAADDLKAISFLGAGYQWFIPAWKQALQKGIAISNTPGGPAQEVAEWAVTACLMMNREFLDLGLVGKKKFAVTKGIESQKVGIIGLGSIGTRLAEMLKPFRPDSIYYFSQHQHKVKEKQLGLKYLGILQLLSQSDIVFVCVSDDAKGLIGAKELGAMKKNALLVNITHPGIIQEEALYQMLKDNRIRAISDHPMSLKFNDLPLSRWYCMKTSNTITEAGVNLMSDMAVESMINLLTIGKDKYAID